MNQESSQLGIRWELSGQGGRQLRERTLLAKPWLGRADDFYRLTASSLSILAITLSSSESSKDRLVRFFEDCWHLVEWLGRDSSVPGIDQKYVSEAALASPAMKVCEAVANTSKHHTRLPKLPTALVKSVTLTNGNPTALIKYSEGNRDTEHDAQPLATECMAWWHQFFADNGIVVP